MRLSLKYRYCDNGYGCTFAGYSECVGKKLNGKYTEKQECLNAGGHCCASASDGTGVVSIADNSHNWCGHCFKNVPQLKATIARGCPGRRIGWFHHMHNCKRRGGHCCENRYGAVRCRNSGAFCGNCFN